ncbi:hypothetical protein H0H87_009011, partial [Tephrocybe sp. NHM501043]
MSNTTQSSLASHSPEESGGILQAKGLSGLSAPRKVVLLIFLCLAQFLDTFANSSLFAAIPPISVELGITNADSVWLISGYQLTFASLLLISGRLSDLYNPKYVFLSGATAIAIFSLAAGFVRTQVPLIILRALMGVGAALTVPSALYLIIHLFPTPASQSKAVALFAASAALGNAGLVLFIFGVTTGSVNGWNTARCLTPFIISLFLIAAFFIWEARLPEDMAAIPPSLWRVTNFGILVSSATLPFMWWGAVQLLFSWIWQNVYGWSPIIAAVH